MKTIVFGGGCFWCTEAIFKMLKGVLSVTPGYSGGKVTNPTYEQVSTGTTGHVEVIKIVYDPKQISFEKLLTVFFATHDPTTIDKQGHDIGPQYNSRIFYTTENQKDEAEKFIVDMNAIGDGQKIVTRVIPLGTFYEAEDYHKNYFERNKNAPYCELVINPKLEKVHRDFADLIMHV